MFALQQEENLGEDEMGSVSFSDAGLLEEEGGEEVVGPRDVDLDGEGLDGDGNDVEMEDNMGMEEDEEQEQEQQEAEDEQEEVDGRVAAGQREQSPAGDSEKAAAQRGSGQSLVPPGPRPLASMIPAPPAAAATAAAALPPQTPLQSYAIGAITPSGSGTLSPSSPPLDDEHDAHAAVGATESVPESTKIPSVPSKVRSLVSSIESSNSRSGGSLLQPPSPAHSAIPRKSSSDFTQQRR